MSSAIAELFARNPLKHTQKDIETIVAYYREARKDFRDTGTRSKNPATLTAAEQKTKASGLAFDL